MPHLDVRQNNMKNIISISLVSLTILLLGCAPSTKHPLEGAWILQEMIERDEKYNDKDLTTFKIIFQGLKVSMTSESDGQSAGTFKLDDSKTPKWIDIDMTDPNNMTVRMTGIYSIRDQVLSLCFSDEENEKRPSSLKPSRTEVLLTLKHE
jgi:uncharacterized protein (TIGR03067 family)